MFVRCFTVAALAIGCLSVLSAMKTPSMASEKASAHDFSFRNIDGGQINLAEFAGRPLLVVNTASRCGFTYQYDGLQALYERYRERGFVVLAVPSDDFGGQELDTAAEVKDFCAVNFNLDFPMTDITRVRGTGRHPFYAWAEDRLGSGKAPRWNFHKYLVGPDGNLIAAFPTRVKPGAREIAKAVEALLPEG
ncbi:MAG: glutathione peroxidase [Pseudomonadota bacterium]